MVGGRPEQAQLGMTVQTKVQHPFAEIMLTLSDGTRGYKLRALSRVAQFGYGMGRGTLGLRNPCPAIQRSKTRSPKTP